MDLRFDIEGIALNAPIFIQGHILCSLLGKKSKKSFSFKNQVILANPSMQLIQVGKMVLDQSLHPVHIAGQKLSALGPTHIHLGNNHIQEVVLGLGQRAFWNIGQEDVFNIEGEIIRDYLGSLKLQTKNLAFFKSDQRTFAIDSSTAEVIKVDGQIADPDISSHIQINGRDLLFNQTEKQEGYFDIQDASYFHLENCCDSKILAIEDNFPKNNKGRLLNIRSQKKSFVYDEEAQNQFVFPDGQSPTSVQEASFYPKRFAIAEFDEIQKLFYLKDRVLLQLSPNQTEVKEIQVVANQKLLNALSAQDEKIVLDIRQGIKNIKQALSFGQVIEEVVDKAHPVGDSILQNAKIKTLGGNSQRVIDLNHEELAVFTLPGNLHVFPDNEDKKSIFHLNPIRHIDFENKIEIEQEKFLQAEFIPYNGNPLNCIIQESNARPLHIASTGYKNELVTGFVQETITQAFYIGKNRMIGSTTLTEDLSAKNLMFSFPEKKADLAFDESYLPVLSEVRSFVHSADWEYYLFQIRNYASSPEFLAVEKIPPYRLLVVKSSGVELPKLIKDVGNALKTPEEISRFKKLFYQDPGYLREI